MLTGGTCSLQWGTRCCSTRNTCSPYWMGLIATKYCLDLSATRHIFYKFSCIFSVERLSLTYAAPLALRGRTA